jgi:predicted O-methyltransferase YrrM
MKFTQDWFTSNIGNFEAAKQVIPNNKKFLEIGCFEGRATCWMLQNMLADDGEITCVDTFKGGQEHSNLNLTDLRKVFEENVYLAQKHDQYVQVIERTSVQALARIIISEQEFDFIYVDGSHEIQDVITDACMAFQVLKPGGVMLFDDYEGTEDMKAAIHSFLVTHRNKCKLLCMNYQLAIQKD